MSLSLVTIDQIEDRLGRPLTGAEQRQVPLWIEDAEAAIERRMIRLGVSQVDINDRVRVVQKAVTAMAKRPDDATRVDIAVDDARVGRTYSSSTGEVTIKDEWWDELGLTEPGASTGWSGSIAYGRY